MKAVVITEPGKPEVLKIEERPMPTHSSNEVLIKVFAAGVNRPDVAQRKGHYPAPAFASQDIPGLEIAGVIERVGDRVQRYKVGDEVCALVAGGGYAEYAAAPEGQCLPIPAGLTVVEAASLPETFFTVWSNVFQRGRLKSGDSFLVQGGTSGIGVTAIQLGRAFGAKVFATAGTDEKCRFCEMLGAVKAVNYKHENWAEALTNEGNGQGIDLILDMIGGPYLPAHLDLLAEEGRLVFINVMKGDEASLKLSVIMRKRLTLTGSTLRGRDVNFKNEIARSLEKHVWPLLANRTVKPIIFETFPLSSAREAHELIESSKHIGKVVLTLGETS